MTDAVRYGVTCAYIGFDKDVPISAEEFAAAQRARVTLSVGLGVEEKFDIALENHADSSNVISSTWRLSTHSFLVGLTSS